MSLHSDRFLLQTVRVFFRIFQIVLKVFLFRFGQYCLHFSTSETSVTWLGSFVYEARIVGYNYPSSLITSILITTTFNNLSNLLHTLNHAFNSYQQCTTWINDFSNLYCILSLSNISESINTFRLCFQSGKVIPKVFWILPLLKTE